MIGLSTHLVRRLQSPLNAAARLIFKLRRFDHITDVLVSLHWLRVSERVVYKIATLTFKVLHGIAPEYLRLVVHVADLLASMVDSLFALLALTAWRCPVQIVNNWHSIFPSRRSSRFGTVIIIIIIIKALNVRPLQ